MTWLCALLAGAVITLLILLIVKVKKIASLEKENAKLQTDKASLQLRVNTLNNDIKVLKQTYKEIRDVEQKKEQQKEEYKAPTAGDSDTRLDLLNK